MKPRSRILAAAAQIAAAAVLAALCALLAPAPAGARVVQEIGATGPARLHYPTRVAIGPSGVIYVLTGGDRASDPNRIRTYSPAGVLLRSWFTPPATTVPDLAVDGSGNAYVTKFDSREVLKYSPTGQLVARWSAPAVASGEDAYPVSLAVDSAGNVVVVEGTSQIETFEPDGTLLSTSRGQWDGNNEIFGIAGGPSGTVYVANRRGISSLDRSDGTLRLIIGPERLRRFSPRDWWGVVAGPSESIYARHGRVIQKFAADGSYEGSIGGDRRANWISAAVAGDGTILVPQWGLGLPRAAVIRLAPITSIDETLPSIRVASIAGPRAAAPGQRLLARLRYTLSEAATFRVVLKRRARTTNRRHREFGRFIHVATIDVGVTPAGARPLVLDRRAFGYARLPAPGTFQVTLVARDDAGNESLPARAEFAVPRRR